ncbi:MAG: ATP synthase F1 subunit gamma [Minisyncoccota bacterium]
MSLKSIKGKIISVKKTHQVTKAMEAVSAVKMRKAQATALMGRPYALAAASILKRIMKSTAQDAHPLMRENGSARALVILITSDKGLAGALSAMVIKETFRMVENEALDRGTLSFITLGKKGFEYVSKRGFEIRENLVIKGEEISLEEINRIIALVVDQYRKGTFGSVYLAYTHFRSTMTQEPLVRKIVPVRVDDINKAIQAMVPERGKFSSIKEEGEQTAEREYIFEPNMPAVLDQLMPFLLSVQVYHAIMESFASEHSARMVAMKNASNKAEEVTDDLTRVFNRERQAAITREVSEIVGGVEAMRE